MAKIVRVGSLLRGRGTAESPQSAGGWRCHHRMTVRTAVAWYSIEFFRLPVNLPSNYCVAVAGDS